MTLWERGRCRTVVGLALLCLPLASACGGADGAASETLVTLEVQDGWVREPGEECAGSRPYLYIHRGAPYRIEAPGGNEIDSGSLPSGTAVEAYNEDLGSERIPTFCRFRLPVAISDEGDHRLVLSEGPPLEFSVGTEIEEPILVIVP